MRGPHGGPQARTASAGWPQGIAVGEVIVLSPRAVGDPIFIEEPVYVKDGAPTPPRPTDITDANDATVKRFKQMHAGVLYDPTWAHAGVGMVGNAVVVIFGRACTVESCVSGRGYGQPLVMNFDTEPPPPEYACYTTKHARLLDHAANRATVRVRLRCRHRGQAYTARVGTGRFARVVRLSRSRTSVTVRVPHTTRYLAVAVVARKTSTDVSRRVGKTVWLRL